MVTAGWRAVVVGRDLPSDGLRLSVGRPRMDGHWDYLTGIGEGGLVATVQDGAEGPWFTVPSDVALALLAALNQHLFGAVVDDRHRPLVDQERDRRQVLENWFDDERARVDRLIGALIHEVGVDPPATGVFQ